MSRQVTPLGRQSTPPEARRQQETGRLRAISSSSNLEWKEDKAEAPKKSEVRAPRASTWSLLFALALRKDRGHGRRPFRHPGQMWK